MQARTSGAVGAAAILTLSLAAPVAAGASTEVLAEGLNAPRGISIGSDGAIYVAEAGTGGDDCPMGEAGVCFGPTGAIIRIADGTAERIVEGLPSVGNPQEQYGVSDVVALDDGSLLAIINLGMDPAARQEGSSYGYLASISAEGQLTLLADVAAFESSDDPDGGAAPDSNPHSIALAGEGTLVADAGGNDLLLVGEDDGVSLVTVFPPTVHEFPAEMLAAMGPPPGEEMPDGEEVARVAAEGEAATEAEPMPEMVPIPVESVPTSVVVGPDGAYYVGELTGGPFPTGGAKIYRLEPGAEPEVYATGLTNVMDLGFASDGTLYVAEIAHEGLLPVFMGEAPPVGAIMAVPPGGGEATLFATGEEFMALGGLAVDADDSIIVSTNTLMPGAGAVVRVTDQ